MAQKIRIPIVIVLVLLLFIFTFWLGGYIQENSHLQEIVSSFGFFGILFTSFVSGLNLIIPLPAVAFIPIFNASGFSIPIIIGGIVIGTTIADLLSYYAGTFGKTYVDRSKNKIILFFKDCCSNRKYMASFVIFVYSTLVPLPNELLLVPLGTLGFKLRHLIVPFTLGTVLHVSIVAYGVTTLFELVN